MYYSVIDKCYFIQVLALRFSEPNADAFQCGTES